MDEDCFGFAGGFLKPLGRMIRDELTPGQLYEKLLAEKEEAGRLKGLEKELGITYGYLKNFMSAMGKLEPEVREKVQWGGRHANAKLAGRIGVSEAFILSRVGGDKQKALSESLLNGTTSSFRQLVTAVSMVQRGMPAESAAKSAPSRLTSKGGRVAAGFMSFISLLRYGFVVPSFLVQVGINRRMAQRAVVDLREAGIVDGYFLSTRMKRMMREMLSKNVRNVLALLADLSGLLPADDATFEKAIAVLRKRRQEYLESRGGTVPAA